MLTQKVCPTCGAVCPANAFQCQCGAYFPPVMAPPTAAGYPRGGPGPNPYAGLHVPPSDLLLTQLAAEYRQANKTFLWTVILGIFCLHPLWIWSFIEWNKMKDLKIRVASMGVDVYWWQDRFGAK